MGSRELSAQEIEVVAKQLNRIESEISLGNFGIEDKNEIVFAIAKENLPNLSKVISELITSQNNNGEFNYPNILGLFAKQNMTRRSIDPNSINSAYPQITEDDITELIETGKSPKLEDYYVNAQKPVMQPNQNTLFDFTIKHKTKPQEAVFDISYEFNKYEFEDIKNGEQQFTNIATLVFEGYATLKSQITGSADVRYPVTNERLKETLDFVSSQSPDTKFNDLKRSIRENFGEEFLSNTNSPTGEEMSEDEQLVQFLASQNIALLRSYTATKALKEKIEEKMEEGATLSPEVAKIKKQLDSEYAELESVVTKIQGKVLYDVSTLEQKQQLLEDFFTIEQSGFLDKYVRVTPRQNGSQRTTPEISLTISSGQEGQLNIDRDTKLKVIGRTSYNNDNLLDKPEDYPEWLYLGRMTNDGNIDQKTYEGSITNDNVAINNGYENNGYENDNSQAFIDVREKNLKALAYNSSEILQGEQDLNVDIPDVGSRGFDPSKNVRKDINVVDLAKKVQENLEAKEEGRYNPPKPFKNKTEPKKVTPEGFKQGENKPREDFDKKVEMLLKPKDIGLRAVLHYHQKGANFGKLQSRTYTQQEKDQLNKDLLAISAPIVTIPMTLALKGVMEFADWGIPAIKRAYDYVEGTANQIFNGDKLSDSDLSKLQQTAVYLVTGAIELNDEGKLFFNEEKFQITEINSGSNKKFDNPDDSDKKNHSKEVGKKLEDLQEIFPEVLKELIENDSYLETIIEKIRITDFSKAYNGDVKIANAEKEKIIDKLTALKEQNSDEQVVESLVNPLKDQLKNPLANLPRKPKNNGSTYISFATEGEQQAKQMVIEGIKEYTTKILKYNNYFLEKKSIINPDNKEFQEKYGVNTSPSRINLFDVEQSAIIEGALDVTAKYLNQNGFYIVNSNYVKAASVDDKISNFLDYEEMESMSLKKLMEIRKNLFLKTRDREQQIEIPLESVLEEKMYEIFVNEHPEYNAKNEDYAKDLEEQLNVKLLEEYQQDKADLIKSVDTRIYSLTNKARFFGFEKARDESYNFFKDKAKEKLAEFISEFSSEAFKVFELNIKLDKSGQVNSISWNKDAEGAKDLKSDLRDFLADISRLTNGEPAKGSKMKEILKNSSVPNENSEAENARKNLIKEKFEEISGDKSIGIKAKTEVKNNIYVSPEIVESFMKFYDGQEALTNTTFLKEKLQQVIQNNNGNNTSSINRLG